MNTALILAAGIDPAFQMDIPKQFVVVENIPIIVIYVTGVSATSSN